MSYIMNGDAYPIRVALQTKEGEDVTPENVEDLEITLGRFRKTYAKGEITWDGEKWAFPMTQRESFSFSRSVGYQARAKFIGGDVIGVFLAEIEVVPSQSRAEL